MAQPVSGARPPASADHRWLVLVIVAIAQLMVVLDATVVNIALPSAQRALGFPNADRQWIVTAYALAFGGLLLLGGRIGDMFSRKRVFITGLLGFAGSSALGGAATSFALLVTARSLQGAFGAILAPAALGTLITTFRDPRERGRAFGVFGSVAGAGGAVGLILGGFLTQDLSWRWTLYVNLIFAAIAVAGALVFIRGSKPAPAPHRRGRGTAGRARRVPDRVRFRSRRDSRVVRRPDGRLAGAGRPAHRRVRAGGRTGPRPAAAAAGHPRPHPRRGLPVRRRGGDRPVRRLPVPDLLPADDQGVQPGHRGPGVPADGRRPAGERQRLQQRPAAAHRPPHPDLQRPADRGGRDGLPHPAQRDVQLRRRGAARADPAGPGLRDDPRPGHQHRHHRRAARGFRRGLGAGQHHAAGGRLGRRLGAEHGRPERHG